MNIPEVEDNGILSIAAFNLIEKYVFCDHVAFHQTWIEGCFVCDGFILVKIWSNHNGFIS